jgi:hypothetical protein
MAHITAVEPLLPYRIARWPRHLITDRVIQSQRGLYHVRSLGDDGCRRRNDDGCVLCCWEPQVGPASEVGQDAGKCQQDKLDDVALERHRREKEYNRGQGRDHRRD